MSDIGKEKVPEGNNLDPVLRQQLRWRSRTSVWGRFWLQWGKSPPRSPLPSPLPLRRHRESKNVILICKTTLFAFEISSSCHHYIISTIMMHMNYNHSLSSYTMTTLESALLVSSWHLTLSLLKTSNPFANAIDNVLILMLVLVITDWRAGSVGLWWVARVSTPHLTPPAGNCNWRRRGPFFFSSSSFYSFFSCF